VTHFLARVAWNQFLLLSREKEEPASVPKFHDTAIGEGFVHSEAQTGVFEIGMADGGSEQ